tara:strand:+ start:1644 stop:1748 length:105 start_codon:yes stop_codon:yes gene_type:complete
MAGEEIGVHLLLLILFGFFILWITDPDPDKKDDE